MQLDPICEDRVVNKKLDLSLRDLELIVSLIRAKVAALSLVSLSQETIDESVRLTKLQVELETYAKNHFGIDAL